MCEVQV